MQKRGERGNLFVLSRCRFRYMNVELVRSTEIYLSMAGAKKLVTLDLSWFRPGGRTSSRDVLEALYCVAPWFLRRGATSKEGEEVGPPGPRGTD
jgi:hypothetical protein